MEKIKDPNTALLLNFHDGCFIFYHFPIGQVDVVSLTFTFIKHPHSLQVKVGLNNLGHAAHISNRANAVSLSTLNIASLPFIFKFFLIDKHWANHCISG